MQNHCSICIQKNISFYKRLPSKQIIMNAPIYRYVVDLIYLPIELCKNTNYIYILNRLDHFSKYFISELIIKIQVMKLEINWI